ncbi:MAG: HINT domain-containing protein, partial [Proteobacteria bacterium]|nr:HINT domain-containing protein [Pseudomonadota bacterium]
YEYFDWVDPVGNFVMGAVDTVTGGATAWLRDKAGLGDQANPCSAAYRYGGYTATAGEMVMGGAGLLKGAGRFAARRAAKMCFAEGTLVETFDGYKPIEEISVDDWVWSRDDETGEEGWRPVVQAFVTVDQEVLDLHLNDANGNEQQVRSKNWHYILPSDSKGCRRLGRCRPRRSRSAAWARSGRTTQRSRRSRLGVVAMGRTTSTLWIAPSSSKMVRGLFPPQWVRLAL